MTPNKSLGLAIIGVTGNTGSGKTTVTGLLAGYGGLIIDADILSHKAIIRGKPAYTEIVNTFGPSVLDRDGEIDRKKLGSSVFGDRNKLTALENMIHPRVCEETFSMIRQAAGRSPEQTTYNFAVIDAPLLIEAGMHAHCDSVWLVTAPFATKEARIIRRDGLPQSAAEQRMHNQRNEEDLRPFSDIVIQNDSDLSSLTAQVQEALRVTAARLGFIYA